MPSVVFFNNCKCRDHVKLYGAGAFFDLDADGHQGNLALNLPVGQRCVVASYEDDGRVMFKWFLLSEEKLMSDENDGKSRVFIGKLINKKVLTKDAAAKSPCYSTLFNRRGQFKQVSVIEGEIRKRAIPNPVRTAKSLVPDEESDCETYAEGATREVVVNAYERSAKAITKCKEVFGFKCAVCELDFEEKYGSEMKGFIHVHHLKPLAEIKKSYEINPRKDLRPVCPNCHAVIHGGGKLRSIAKVKAMMRKAAKK